jgi:hypothetical protein
MCERSPLGLPHTQNRMSGRPQVAEILLMRSPQTPPTCGQKCAPNSCLPERVFSMFNTTFGEDQKSSFGDYTTLSWQCSHSTTNTISEVLLFSVCVCNAIYIYMYPVRPRANGVCVCAERYLSIYLKLSIYIPIYLSRMYLSICSWPLSCQRCLCWSLSCVCVCVCVCVCL